MNSLLLALFGFIGGLIFGMLLAWGMISLVVGMVGVIILLAGTLLPSLFRPMFLTAILGFLISWIVSGGLSLL
jgi:hypothetical protein